jgi:hypothetical protein
MHYVLVVCLICAACGSDPQATQDSSTVACEKLREHLLDVRVAGVTSHRDAHRAALSRSLGDDFVARCERTKTQADLDCEMAAKTTAQLRVCRASQRGER